MMAVNEKARQLLKEHSRVCDLHGGDYLAGVKYVPEFSYEYDEIEEKTVFNQDFHDKMLNIGVIDSEQSVEERGAVGQALIIPTKELIGIAWA